MSLFKKIFNRKEKVRKEAAVVSEKASIIDSPLDISWKSDATSFDNGDYIAEVAGTLPFKEENGRVFFDGPKSSYSMFVDVKNREGKVQHVEFDLQYSGVSCDEVTQESFRLASFIKDENKEVLVDENGKAFCKSIGAGRNSWGTDLLGDVRKLLAGMVSKKRDSSSELEEHFEGLVRFAAKALDDKIALEEDRVQALVRQRNEKKLQEQAVTREAFSRF